MADWAIEVHFLSKKTLEMCLSSKESYYFICKKILDRLTERKWPVWGSTADGSYNAIFMGQNDNRSIRQHLFFHPYALFTLVCCDCYTQQNAHAWICFRVPLRTGCRLSRLKLPSWGLMHCTNISDISFHPRILIIKCCFIVIKKQALDNQNVSLVPNPWCQSYDVSLACSFGNGVAVYPL